MKNLTKFINERMDNSFSLNGMKFKIIPRSLMGKNGENIPIFKETEAEVLNTIKDALNDNFKAMTSEDFAKLNGKKYTPEYDLKNGDIIITDKNNNLVEAIDIKAASKNSDSNLLGPVCMRSLMNFGKDSKNHSYLVLNKDGSEYYWIDANKLYTEFMKSPSVMASDHRNKKSNIEAKVSFHKNYAGDTSDTTVYEEDFIPSVWIRKNISKIKK